MTTGSVARRNDPCPCGSGKKYKKCCMGKLETMDQGLLRLLRQEFERINQSIYDYSRRHFSGELDHFFKTIKGFHSLPFSFQEVIQEYAGIWGIFKLKVKGGKTPFEYFVEAYSKENRRQAAIDMVASWKQAHFSIYYIQAIDENGSMTLQDVWTKEQAPVPIPKGNKTPDLGSLLIGLRVQIYENAQEFMMGYAEVESHIWSAKKLDWIHKTYLSHTAQSIGDQFDQSLPEIFVHLISDQFEKPIDGESEQAHSAVHLFETSEDQKNAELEVAATIMNDAASKDEDALFESPETASVERTGTTAQNLVVNGNSKVTSMSRSKDFSGSASQKEAVELYLSQVDQTLLDPETIERVTGIWRDYVLTHNPVIKKPAAYAAALDYFANMLDENGQATQSAISQKYGISSATVSKNYRLLNDFAAQLADEGRTLIHA